MEIDPEWTAADDERMADATAMAGALVSSILRCDPSAVNVEMGSMLTDVVRHIEAPLDPGWDTETTHRELYRRGWRDATIIFVLSVEVASLIHMLEATAGQELPELRAQYNSPYSVMTDADVEDATT